MKLIHLILIILLLPNITLGAKIYGNIYNVYDFEEADSVIVTINSIPEQKYVATEGSYEFVVSPGTYYVEAKYYEDNILTQYIKEETIITDEGGVTSHAAIISRELNIPCIIETKNATDVLKDGDIVEIDVIKGIIKIN